MKIEVGGCTPTRCSKKIDFQIIEKKVLKGKSIYFSEATLAEIITKATEKFAEMTDSLIKFKQSVLEVSRIQEQMAKHRLTSELAILDKQESIRNRVNQALKRSPDAIGQAVDDLQNRISLLFASFRSYLKYIIQ